jgi:hypothetical protein
LLSHANTILLALNLVPFAGISFLWFMGVFRDHLGCQGVLLLPRQYTDSFLHEISL